jgi:D-3-phosphoglycerate dehydrogenase
MPSILVTTSSFGSAAQAELAELRRAGYAIVLNPHGRRLGEEEVGALLGPDVVGMIAGVEPLTRRVLAGAKGLRVVSRCGIGLDSVDLAAARELGIEVLNTPDAPSAAVAELTLGLALAALRRIALADRQVRAGLWHPLMGRLLASQVAGVVGYGRIGRRVAALFAAFGCRVLACDPAARAAASGVTLCALDELLAQADIVSLHVPLEPGTARLIDAARIARMKKGAILVNVSRGGLVDEAALHAALAEGRLAGAALDVFEREPYAGPLAGLDQVVLTAHMGSAAEETRAVMEREAAQNLVRALAAKGLMMPAGRNGT